MKLCKTLEVTDDEMAAIIRTMEWKDTSNNCFDTNKNIAIIFGCPSNQSFFPGGISQAFVK
jgi:hypothetical protein